jgi:hypothetical protein
MMLDLETRSKDLMVQELKRNNERFHVIIATDTCQELRLVMGSFNDVVDVLLDLLLLAPN